MFAVSPSPGGGAQLADLADCSPTSRIAGRSGTPSARNAGSGRTLLHLGHGASSRSAVWCAMAASGLQPELEHPGRPDALDGASAGPAPSMTRVVSAAASTRTVVSRQPLQRPAAGPADVPRRRRRATRRAGAAAALLAASRRPEPRTGGLCGPGWPTAGCQPLHLDLGGASGRRVAHRIERRRDRLPVASFPCRGRGRPWRDQQPSAAGQPRGARRTGEAIGLATRHVSAVWLYGASESRSPSSQRRDLRSLARDRGRLVAMGLSALPPTVAPARTPTPPSATRRARSVASSGIARAPQRRSGDPMGPIAVGDAALRAVHAGAVPMHSTCRERTRSPGSAMRREDVADRHRPASAGWSMERGVPTGRARAVGRRAVTARASETSQPRARLHQFAPQTASWRPRRSRTTPPSTAASRSPTAPAPRRPAVYATSEDAGRHERLQDAYI